MRINDKKDEQVTTENNNYRLRLYFEQWLKSSEINPILKNISGLVDTSLFYGNAHKAL